MDRAVTDSLGPASHLGDLADASITAASLSGTVLRRVCPPAAAAAAAAWLADTGDHAQWSQPPECRPRSFPHLLGPCLAQLTPFRLWAWSCPGCCDGSGCPAILFVKWAVFEAESPPLEVSIVWSAAGQTIHRQMEKPVT